MGAGSKNIIKLGLVLTVVGALVGLLLWFTYPVSTQATNYIVNRGNNYIYDEILGSFSNIDFNLRSGIYNIIPSDSFGVFGTSNNPLDIEVIGDTLFITERLQLTSSIGVINIQNDQALDIRVPHYLENANIELTSGQINIGLIDIEDSSIHLTSGRLIINDMTGRNIDISMTSGSMSLNAMKGEDVHLSITSGNVSWNEAVFNNADFRATSGRMNINVDDYRGNFSYTTHSSSGRIRINGDASLGQEQRGHINARITSGDININFR